MKKLVSFSLLIIIASVLSAYSFSTSLNTMSEKSVDLNEPTSKQEINQWYLNDSENNNVYYSDESWALSERVSKKGVDIGLNNGKKHYSPKRKVTIAVIDTSIDFDYYDKTDNIFVNKGEVAENGIDDDKNGYIDDVYGYSFVEETDDDQHANSIMSVLIGCNKMKDYLSILDGTDCYVLGVSAISPSSDINNVVKAIEYAQAQNADICCMAFDTYQNSKELKQAIEKSNMLFVVPSGNDGVELGEEINTYPAMYRLDNVIVVGDMRSDGNRSDLSNYSNKYVDVFAPGTDILTVVNGNKMEYTSGTSAATAIVSAVCAIVRSQYDMTANQTKEFICSNSSGKNNYSKYGNLSQLKNYIY